MERKIICALDTGDLDEALSAAKRLLPYVGAFKIGHGLVLPYGLSVVGRFRDLGVKRIFLDLKFHDIPNSVALAVRESMRYGVWMLTLHAAGGPAMMAAASEEARSGNETDAPLLMGVTVLTSLDQHTLTDYLGVGRTVEQQMVELSKLGVDCGLDGVIASPQEVKPLRAALGKRGLIVTPGVRVAGQPMHDQVRTGSAIEAIQDGADYVVIGRNLMASEDIPKTLAAYGFSTAGTTA